jgi:hypothetical protein
MRKKGKHSSMDVITKNKFRAIFTGPKRNKVIALAIALLIIVAATVIVITQAAGFFASVEPDTGTLATNAKVVTDSSASGGKAVQFTAPVVPPPVTPPPTGGTCALPNYPSASCTGVPVGTNLTVVSGDLHITTAGSVVEGKDIRGCVFVEAASVTIRKSKITCDFAFGIHALAANYSGVGPLIEDVEISCDGSSATGVAGYGFTARRVNAYGCENAFSVDNNVTIEDSYIHDLYHATGAHTDGIQLSGGSNITIRHNKILNQDTNGTSAIIGDTASFSNVLITNNLLGGGGYTLYCADSVSPNYRVTNNRWSRSIYPNGGFYGPWRNCQLATEVTGNVWDDTSQPVPF